MWSQGTKTEKWKGALCEEMSRLSVSRGSLLEEFRRHREQFGELADIRGWAVEFAKDQHGSRFLQEKVESATEGEKEWLLGELSGSLPALMMDVFGNYVVQKLLEFGTREQRRRVCGELRGRVLGLSLHMYGCRVVQKALEWVGTALQVEMGEELRGHVMRCVRDQNGNHVIQKCIEAFPPLHLEGIMDSLRGNVFELSTHCYGCRVIQRVLEHCPTWQTVHVLEELQRDCARLMENQYGNYVIQHVVRRDRAQVIRVIRGRLIELSQHKFASNVVEKCILEASPSEKQAILDELLADPRAFLHVASHMFGNYVVQQLIPTLQPDHPLLTLLRQHQHVLRKYPYAKHVLAKLN